MGSKRIILVVSHISVYPVGCFPKKKYSCFCYYDQNLRFNISNCSSDSMTDLPDTISPGTDVLRVQKTNIVNLCGSYDYLDTIWYLDLKTNFIEYICDTFILQMKYSHKLKRLNLANNKLDHVPIKMRNLTNMEKIWLAGNPFHCNCSMTWMIQWLKDFTRLSQEHVIVDYKQLTCSDGKMKGEKIFNLNEIKMGCYPFRLALWIKSLIGVGSGVGLAIITILLALIAKRSREVKFLMFYYLKLDTVPKDDRDENLDNIEYDAFFCYRFVIIHYVQSLKCLSF